MRSAKAEARLPEDVEERVVEERIEGAGREEGSKAAEVRVAVAVIAALRSSASTSSAVVRLNVELAVVIASDHAADRADVCNV